MPPRDRLTGDVVPSGQGTGHQQITHPAKGIETIREIVHGRRHAGHATSLMTSAWRLPVAAVVLSGDLSIRCVTFS